MAELASGESFNTDAKAAVLRFRAMQDTDTKSVTLLSESKVYFDDSDTAYPIGQEETATIRIVKEKPHKPGKPDRPGKPEQPGKPHQWGNP